MDKTRGQIEAEITSALIKFEKEYLGRGPTNARTFIIEDMVYIFYFGDKFIIDIPNDPFPIILNY